ncbi:hypothetical protein KOW79_004758 [Hemibagrus wyckioides]|uniref:Uncharacterized protein n=1 Tax=Hemibagrus wyckioides TaxID=337641 RepID=A0A9D3NYC0_9TELE|nr:hypothetical protein KOW79_004758 [Hemibagrus wyckioides]
MLLWISLLCLQSTRGQTKPDITSPGLASGIVLRDQPGLLITNCRTHTQKVLFNLPDQNMWIQVEPAEKRDTVRDDAEPQRDLTGCPTILIHLPSNPHEPPASRPFRQLLAKDIPYRLLLVQKGGTVASPGQLTCSWGPSHPSQKLN